MTTEAAKIEQATTYLSALASSLTVGVLIPLLILGLMVFGIWMLLSRAQNDPEFDIAQILRDSDTNKVSMTQTLKMGAFASSTFVLVVVVFALPNLLLEIFIAYLGTWGLTTMGSQFIARKWPAPDGK